MAYNANIPQATDQMSHSQADILENFLEIDSVVAIDHSGFGTPNEGKHNQVRFPVAAAPAATPVTEVGMYCAASGGTNELFINKNASQIPFTKSSKTAQGWTYLPSGILMQWGTGTCSNGGTVVNFPMVFPTACLSVQLTAYTDATNNWFVMTNTFNATRFIGYATTRSGGATSASVYFLAIGY